MKIPVGKSCFVDTNILVYATVAASPWHLAAIQYLNRARQAGRDLVVSQQILREYLAVVSKPGFQAEVRVPMEDIRQNLGTFQREARLVEDDLAVFAELAELTKKYTFSGKQVHDANIVATMLTYDVDHILTQNVKDFKRFSDVIAILSLIVEGESEASAASS